MFQRSAVMLAALVIFGCAPEGGKPAPASLATATSPPAVAPAATTALPASAFAGRWLGTWDGSFGTTSILNINPPGADGQITGTYQFMQTAPSSIRSRIENNSFRFGSAASFVFRLSPDGRLYGERTFQGTTNRITATRVQ